MMQIRAYDMQRLASALVHLQDAYKCGDEDVDDIVISLILELRDLINSCTVIGN